MRLSRLAPIQMIFRIWLERQGFSMKWSRALVGGLTCLVLPALVSAQAFPAGLGAAGQSLGSTLDAGEYHSCGLFENATQNGAFENAEDAKYIVFRDEEDD